MTSPNKPTSKPLRVAKMSVKPIWRKKLNPCNTSNELNVSSPTPMPKPLTPHHEPSQENNHPNHASPNPYIKDTPTSPQVVSHPPFPISPINSHVTHTQAPPQSDNQTQHTPPLSPKLGDHVKLERWQGMVRARAARSDKDGLLGVQGEDVAFFLVPKVVTRLGVTRSARSYVMQCTLPTQGMRFIISTVSISPEGFLPSILLLVVIIVTVVIVVVTVILVVVVVAITGVVIVVTIIGVVVIVMIIGVVGVVVVSSIIKLLFVIIGSLLSIVLCYLIH
ncbi:hypothetical protein Tco_0320559 [Tanacetum coccineum]